MSHVCQRVQREMSVYRELDPDARRAVDRAVAECGRCSAAWADEQLVLAHLAAMPDLAPPARLKASLHAIPNTTPAPVPVQAADPLFGDLSLRLLLMLLAATAMWLYMLTVGSDSPPFGGSDPEAGQHAQAGPVDGPAPEVAAETGSRPQAIERAMPVDLGASDSAPSRRFAADRDVDSAAETERGAAPAASQVADPALDAVAALAPEGRGRPGSGPAAGTSPPAAGGDGRDDEREGAGGVAAAEDPPSGDEGVRSCATVEIRPFYDLPSGAADCGECGDGVADENELETARAMAASLPGLRIDVELAGPDGTVGRGEAILIDAGTHARRIAMPCALFEHGDVTLSATAVGLGAGALCPSGGAEAGHTLRVPAPSGAATIRFAIPVRPVCAVAPTLTPTSIPTPTLPPAPSPTAVPSASPSPTVASTPGPRDPGPAMPTSDPSPMPTATYQPSPTPTSIWPQDGVQPAP